MGLNLYGVLTRRADEDTDTLREDHVMTQRETAVYLLRREASEETDLELELPAPRIVRQYISAVEATQSAVLC